MKRILVVEYSQSGDVTQVAAAFTRPLERPGVEIVRESLRPVEPYPYPWGTLRRLLSVFPECHLGPTPALKPPVFNPAESFDLIVLAYQVWFLAPSLPVQAFLVSDHARVLRDRPVVTLCVSRNMWQSGSEKMKGMLREAGAVHLDNVVVTHQGPAYATFVSVPRAILKGKRDRLWGVFPPAGLSAADLKRVERLGDILAGRLDDLGPPYRPVLGGEGAVTVRRRAIVPELLGWYLYNGCARLVSRLPRPSLVREVAICLCIGLLLLVILLVLPLTVVLVFLLSPFLRGPLDRYARRLAEPSG